MEVDISCVVLYTYRTVNAAVMFATCIETQEISVRLCRMYSMAAVSVTCNTFYFGQCSLHGVADVVAHV